MNCKDLAKALDILPEKMSVLLKGTHGIGKTEWCKNWAQEKGLKLVIWHASHAADAGDITGLPFHMEDEFGNKITKFAPPSWMINQEPVLLLLDEINRGLSVAMNACMQLTNDQTYDAFKLPEGSRIIACINPDEDGTYDVGRLDAAQLDRFAVYDFKPTPQEWLTWASEHGVDERIIRYINQFPTNLDPFENQELVKSVQGKDCAILPSRRAWTHLSEAIVRGDKQNMFDGPEGVALMVNIASGIVGPTIALDFQRFFKAKDVLNPKDLLNAKTFKKEWTKKLSDMSKNDTPDTIKFMQGVALYLKGEEKAMIESKKGDKALLKLYADNFLSILDAMSPEVQISIVNDIVIKASDNGERWVSVIQAADKSYKKRFDDMYMKAALAEDGI